MYIYTLKNAYFGSWYRIASFLPKLFCVDSCSFTENKTKYTTGECICNKKHMALTKLGWALLHHCYINWNTFVLIHIIISIHTYISW